MNKPKYRVIQWGTGRVGMPTLRGILERQDFELVGLYVSSAAKEGRDAGDAAAQSSQAARSALASPPPRRATALTTRTAWYRQSRSRQSPPPSGDSC